MKSIMKKTFVIIALSLFIFIGFLIFFKKNKSDDKTLILTTSRPLYIALNEICKDTSGVLIKEITNGYMNSHSCLHDFSLTTQQIEDIEKCYLLAYNGVSFEPFINKINSNNLCDSSKNIEILENNGEKNPFIWMSVTNYIKQIKNIMNEINSPERKSTKMLDFNELNKINKNYENYTEKLKSKREEWKSKFEEYKGMKIATLTNEFDYLLKDLGLIPVHLIERHIHGDLSAKSIMDAEEILKNENLKFYLVSNEKYLNIFKNYKGVLLDLIKSQDKISYIDEMENNVNILLNNIKEFK